MNGHLRVAALSKSFIVDRERVDVLDDINLEIGKGEFISIVGHSGCGKSTFLKIIAGLVSYETGTVELDGAVVHCPGTDRGMVFQDHRLFPWLKIKDNITLGMKNLSKKEREMIAHKYLEIVNLKGFENAYPHQLSGGMSQRAAIARALAQNPAILLLDEPFGALDALSRIQMQKEVLGIWEQEKTTMILVTHDIDEAIYLSDCVAIMSNRPGKIKELIPVNLPRNRDRGGAEFVRIKKRIMNHFFEDSDIDMDFVI
ncbi:sulfonate ABC transporter ATP-binding protein [Clostridia bacterium]|nr:sulfonate ABC transporter ATP-binding protein [Clostridia bacterium]